MDPAARLLFRELLVFGRVALGHYIAKAHAERRVATVPEVSGEDCPLQFLDGRGHAGEALAELAVQADAAAGGDGDRLVEWIMQVRQAGIGTR